MIAKRNVLVYSGEGVSQKLLPHLFHALGHALGSFYDVQAVESSVLVDGGPWEDNCALFVMPGGRDVPYVKALGNKGVSRISSYIRDQGGSYLGICAGAYFASSNVIFSEGHRDYEIKEERGLKFFPGIARGPIFPGFEYDSERGAHATTIRLDDGTQVSCYYNGGCQFEFTNDVCKQWHVLGRYVQYDIAAIIAANVGRGKVVLSGVHPEISHYLPYEDLNHEIATALKKSESKMSDLWLTILSKWLDCATSPVPAFPRRQLVQGVYALQGEVSGFAEFPGCPEYFNPMHYRENLRTTTFGQVMLYAETIDSTQSFLQARWESVDAMSHGIVLLATEQTAGRGRGGNKWISPPLGSSLQFTMMLKDISMEHLCFIQCMAAVAIMKAVRLHDEQAPVFIKWPNDIYVEKERKKLKVGGILVNTTQGMNGRFHALIGMGLNVLRCTPLASLSDVINDKRLSMESMLAGIMYAFEWLYGYLQQGSIEAIRQLYESYWLHGGQLVYIESISRSAIILGIDEYGFLIAQCEDNGEVVKLQPDGNSFDLMANLIKIKG